MSEVSNEDKEQAKAQLIGLLREVISYSRAENLRTFAIPIPTLEMILDEWVRLRALDLSTPREVYVACTDYGCEGHAPPTQAFLRVCDAFAARQFLRVGTSSDIDIFTVPVWPQPAKRDVMLAEEEPSAA